MTRFAATRPLAVYIFLSSCDRLPTTYFVGYLPNRTVEPHEETISVFVNVGIASLRVLFPRRKKNSIRVGNVDLLGFGFRQLLLDHFRLYFLGRLRFVDR